MAPSCTIASPAGAIAASRPANCFWSTRAASTKTAPPTSPARSRSARRAAMRERTSRSCSRATSRSRARYFRTAPRVRSSTRWRGNYRTGAYGIRIENLVLVNEAEPVAGAEKPLNAFETLTLAPLDRRLIEPAMLTADELAWLDAYQARVRGVLTPLVDAPVRAWLDAATAPL